MIEPIKILPIRFSEKEALIFHIATQPANQKCIFLYLLDLTSIFGCLLQKCIKNIARGTTDPEIDSVTLIELGNNMALLALIANLATR